MRGREREREGRREEVVERQGEGEGGSEGGRGEVTCVLCRRALLKLQQSLNRALIEPD